VDTLWLLFIGLSLLSTTAAFIWVAFHISGGRGFQSKDYVGDAEAEVERIFSDEFREELRNRGRLHFEKIISDNAMFLKQDLQLTASDLNKYMQEQIKKVLKEEFAKYEESIEAAKDIAVEAINKTQTALDEQRAALQKQIADEAQKERERIIVMFEENMAQVVNHYLLEAIGNEIDLSNQLDYIFRHLEDNKAAIIEDIRSGSA
jgi:hypothetical protein